MRQATIKNIQELNEREVELLLSDQVLQDDILRYAHDMESYYIDDMLDYIKPYLSDYSIVPYNYSYMKVSNLTGFIHGVNKLDKDYNIFYDDDITIILELAIEASNIHRSVDIGSDIYYDTMDDINIYVNELIECLLNEFVNVLQYYDSFETVSNQSDYVENYLENIHDRDCLVDNDKVTLL